MNVTVLAPGVKFPPLLVQLPPTFMNVAVPASNVPDVNVIFPLRVSVPVLPPTLSVCAVLATVMPLKVWLAIVPLIACAAAVLLKVTVLEPGVKVALLLVQSPKTLMAAAVPGLNVPLLSRTVPLMFKVARLPPPVKVPPPLCVKLLNVWVTAVPFKPCAPPPSKFTVPVPGVKVVPAACVQLPAAVIFRAVPAVKFPVERLKLPLMSRAVVPDAPLRVLPPVLLTVRLLKTLVASVPSILCATLPLKTTVLVPEVNVVPVA